MKTHRYAHETDKNNGFRPMVDVKTFFPIKPVKLLDDKIAKDKFQKTSFTCWSVEFHMALNKLDTSSPQFPLLCSFPQATSSDTHDERN